MTRIKNHGVQLP